MAAAFERPRCGDFTPARAGCRAALSANLPAHARGLRRPRLAPLARPTTLAGAAFYGVLAFVLASIVVLVIRRFSRRLEHRLSDVTVLRFVSLFAQMLVYLAALVLYAHSSRSCAPSAPRCWPAPACCRWSRAWPRRTPSATSSPGSRW